MKNMEVEKERTLVSAAVRAGTFANGDFAVMLRPADLAELTKLLGRNISDADDLLLAARNVTTLSIEGLEGGDITLDSYLLNRLKSRCHPTQDFPQFVRDRVKELLASYAGC